MNKCDRITFKPRDKVRLKGTEYTGKISCQGSPGFNAWFVTGFPFIADAGAWFKPDYLEKVEPAYTLADIRDGDRVTWQSNCGLKSLDCKINIDENICVSHFHLNLQRRIIKVERPNPVTYTLVEPSGTK